LHPFLTEAHEAHRAVVRRFGRAEERNFNAIFGVIRRRPQTKSSRRLAQVTGNSPDHRPLGDEGDDPHRATAPGIQQGPYLVDARQQQRPHLAGCLAMRRFVGRVGRWRDGCLRKWNRQSQEQCLQPAAPVR